jgi:hypothetical protein
MALEESVVFVVPEVLRPDGRGPRRRPGRQPGNGRRGDDAPLPALHLRARRYGRVASALAVVGAATPQRGDLMPIDPEIP